MQQSVKRIGDLVSSLEKNNNYYSHRETVHRNSTYTPWWGHFFESFNF